MLDLKGGWNISFAGCGFMGIYYVGASSCLLEHVPHLVQGASKIYGASAGSLIAAVLSIGIPIEQCCEMLMLMTKDARKRKLGPMHPSFNLLKLVRDNLVRDTPDDAHIKATGKLFVSLTRVSDGKNVLASEFDTREELIQALLCSCFVPFYCGVIPPTYRGVRYVDGAITDNLPHCNLRNTITISPWSGESDICPRESTLNFHEVRFNNVSIQISAENIYRVTSAFFPPETEIMAEICNNGYMDALRFLQENNFFRTECPSAGLLTELESPKPPCCEKEAEPAADEATAKGSLLQRLNPPRKFHWWLDERSIENLPVLIKKVLCQACKERHEGLFAQVTDLLPVRVASYMLLPYTLPVQSAYSLATRLVDWIPDAAADMRWLYGMAGDIYKQAWKGTAEDEDSEVSLRRCSSLPSGLESWPPSGGEDHVLPLTLVDRTSANFYWDTHANRSQLPLTPPPTPNSPSKSSYEGVFQTPSKPADGGWGSGLGRAVGWIRGSVSSQPQSSPSPSKDPQSSASKP